MSPKIPADLRYSKSDEWVRSEGDEVVVGISDYAQDALGDIVYLELPQVGASLTAGTPFGVIESVKASSDLNSPVSGEVVAVNSALDSNQEPINKDPYGEGWLIRVRLTGEEEGLMGAEAYKEYCEARPH